MNSELTPEEKVIVHLESSFIFDIPKGRHRNLIDEYYKLFGKKNEGDYKDKINFIVSNWISFYKFLEKEETYKTKRLGAERQARLEPERTKTAIDTLDELGFSVEVVDRTEIRFQFKGSTIKYFPYSQWASGKTIKDGRGFKNLIDQLK